MLRGLALAHRRLSVPLLKQAMDSTAKLTSFVLFIMVPLLAPAAHKLGIDLVWFGVLLSVNMQTSFMHPPFGFSLFYLRSVAPREVKTTDIYGGQSPS